MTPRKRAHHGFWIRHPAKGPVIAWRLLSEPDAAMLAFIRPPYPREQPRRVFDCFLCYGTRGADQRIGGCASVADAKAAVIAELRRRHRTLCHMFAEQRP